MDTNTSPIPWICGTALLFGVLAGIFALAWHGTLTGQTVVVIVSPIIAGALALLGTHVGTTAIAKNTKANAAMLTAAGKGS